MCWLEQSTYWSHFTPNVLFLQLQLSTAGLDLKGKRDRETGWMESSSTAMPELGVHSFCQLAYDIGGVYQHSSANNCQPHLEEMWVQYEIFPTVHLLNPWSMGGHGLFPLTLYPNI